MATIYTYSLSSDFNEGLNPNQLKHEIDNSSIKTQCFYVLNISTTPDDVDIEFSNEISNEDQKTLDDLILSHSPIKNTPGETFDAVCDPSGNADYLLPSKAFADGHKSVFMRNGIYEETTDILIPEYGSLVGESGPNSIINFGGNSNSIIIDGNDGKFETTGTISIETNSSIVTGNGTNFTKLADSDYILIGTNYFQINTVINDTKLELNTLYKGSSISEISYIAQKMLTGVHLSNFIVTNSSSNGIYIRSCRNFALDKISLKFNNSNLIIENSGNSSLKNIISDSSYQSGIIINNCISTALNVVNVCNNTLNGIEINGINTSINLLSCETSNNGEIGIKISGNSSDINLTDCVNKFNKLSGIYINSSVNNVLIDSTTVRGNGENGIEINGENHRIIGNIIEDNKKTGIKILNNNICSTGNIIRNNLNGIEIIGENCIISNNHIISNFSNGISVFSKDCIISGNVVKKNIEIGININTESIDTMVSLNNVKENGNNNINDLGTDTMFVNNKFTI